jgi:hypothetical protein
MTPQAGLRSKEKIWRMQERERNQEKETERNCMKKTER